MKWSSIVAVVALSIPPHLPGQSAAPSEFAKRVTVEAMRKRSNRVGGGDWDDKTDRVSFTLKFQNTDTKTSFTGYKAEFYVVAESILRRNAFQLLGMDKHQVSLAPRAMQEVETREVVSKYDTTGVRFGSKYDSWVLVVRDPADKVVLTKSSNPQWLPVAERMTGMDPKRFYDRALAPVAVK